MPRQKDISNIDSVFTKKKWYFIHGLFDWWFFNCIEILFILIIEFLMFP